MPKITSARNVRHLRRELHIARSTIRQNALKATTVALKATTVAERTRKEQATYRQTILRLYSQNVLARQNARVLHEMFVEQQEIIRRKQSEIRAMVQKDDSANDSALETARTMIALNQQLCAHCLDTRHILKTKKNKRFIVECKACKVYE